MSLYDPFPRFQSLRLQTAQSRSLVVIFVDFTPEVGYTCTLGDPESLLEPIGL